jgi:hypothetical protein
MTFVALLSDPEFFGPQDLACEFDTHSGPFIIDETYYVTALRLQSVVCQVLKLSSVFSPHMGSTAAPPQGSLFVKRSGQI